MLLSIVVPCYNEEAVLPMFLDEIRHTAEELRQTFGCETEVLFVDDGSRDGTMDVLRDAVHNSAQRLRIRYFSFSRNFGKESAMYAGLQHARGDYVAIMDADLQHPPAMLKEMLDYVRSGEYDCAAARRESREGEPAVRSFFARLFYKIINRISDTEIVDGATDFRVMKRQMVNAVLSLGEVNRFSKGIFSWVGFRTKWLPYENIERAAGETKWSFWGLLLYSIQGIVGFSTVPLVLSAVMGMLLCAAALVDVIYIIIKTLLFGDPVGGWPSMMCMIMFLGGIQLFCMGVLGEYLAKTYLEVKRRPLYVLAESSDDIYPPRTGTSGIRPDRPSDISGIRSYDRPSDVSGMRSYDRPSDVSGMRSYDRPSDVSGGYFRDKKPDISGIRPYEGMDTKNWKND